MTSCGCLAHRHEHRALTWYDDEAGVVWLVAYHRHRSGDPDDAYPYFDDLDARDALLPADEDYIELVRQRDQRFVDSVVIEAPSLLREARDQPGVEQRSMLGAGVGTGAAVEIISDPSGSLEEVTVAISIHGFEDDAYELIPTVLAAFDLGDDWQDAFDIAGREIAEGEELGFRCYVEY